MQVAPLPGPAGLNWHLITCEYPPQFGGVSDYSGQVASGLRAAGADVSVWCAEFEGFTTSGMRPA